MMRAEIHGAGPTLVLVPGLAASRHFFDTTVADLGRDHRVVTVDLPGHGDAPAPAQPPTLSDCAAALHEVVDGLGSDDVTLLGWSLGATVAWTYLETFGTRRVRRLISVEQTPWLLADDGWPYAAFGSLDRAGATALLGDVRGDCGAFAENLVRGSFAVDGPAPDAALVADLVRQARGADAGAVAGLLSDVLTQDWRDRVSALRLPTLLIHGRRSAVYPPEVGDWLAKAMPDARVEFLDHSGHLCFLEEPEAFGAAVRGFLTSEEKQS
ncbi:alpha/beta fold hydrolase [Micromonospora sp. NPDC047730]|uniref:alpha/beta fold hydrolase n=1 Tax=Micromonospora sp. NPDC047730 TaxID=3364253 RepID=UPI0037162B4E